MAVSIFLPGSINITAPQCHDGQQPVNCLNVTVCFRFHGKHVPEEIGNESQCQSWGYLPYLSWASGLDTVWGASFHFPAHLHISNFIHPPGLGQMTLNLKHPSPQMYA